ncbi:hypothetical protein [Nonomuraea rubra]|uniref:hypothetical protein n=1 Tax=Nonomuraea rubra TaxID=46180 RepID=UPI0031EB9275
MVRIAGTPADSARPSMRTAVVASRKPYWSTSSITTPGTAARHRPSSALACSSRRAATARPTSDLGPSSTTSPSSAPNP